jgi:hypothetical protein
VSNYRPRVFYKYFPCERIQFFEDLTLRFSPHVSLNDPFENMPAEQGQQEGMSADEMKALRCSIEDWGPYSADLIGKSLARRFATENDVPELEEVGKRKGALCLSETHDNLLMWAHYASDHRGFVIEIDSKHFFDLADDPNNAWKITLDRVKYREMRPAWQSGNWWDYLHGTLHKMVTTKSTHWSHEQEWRVMRPLDAADSVLDTIDGGVDVLKRDSANNPYHLFKLPHSSLVKVIIGARATRKSMSQIKRYLQADTALAHVRLKLAVPDPVDFRLRFLNLQVSDLPDE